MTTTAHTIVGTTVTAMDKRVRFSPFVTYLGEEEAPPEMEESMRMDGSSVHNVLGSAIRRRSSNERGGKRRSLDLNDMFACMERPFSNLSMGDNSSGGFSFGGMSGSDMNLGGPLSMSASIREEDEEENSSCSASSSGQSEEEQEHKRLAQRTFLGSYDNNKPLMSDSSFPGLSPLGPVTAGGGIMDESLPFHEMDGSMLGLGRAT